MILQTVGVRIQKVNYVVPFVTVFSLFFFVLRSALFSLFSFLRFNFSSFTKKILFPYIKYDNKNCSIKVSNCFQILKVLLLEKLNIHFFLLFSIAKNCLKRNSYFNKNLKQIILFHDIWRLRKHESILTNHLCVST